MITRNDINLVEVQHWSLQRLFATCYMDKKQGIEAITTVNRLRDGSVGNKSSEEYYIKGNKTKFRSLDELIKFMNKTNQP